MKIASPFRLKLGKGEVWRIFFPNSKVGGEKKIIILSELFIVDSLQPRTGLSKLSAVRSEISE